MSNFSVDLLADEFAALYADDNTHLPPQWAIPDEYRTTRDRVRFNTMGEPLADPKRPGEGEESSDESAKAGDQEEYLTAATAATESDAAAASAPPPGTTFTANELADMFKFHRDPEEVRRSKA